MDTKLIKKAADITQEIIDQHTTAIKALETIRDTMKGLDSAFHGGNTKEATEAVQTLPSQYSIVANATFKEAELINELTRTIIEATGGLTSQADYFPENNKTEDLRGYV